MPEDILAELRAKEVELEARINEARREASSIREAALKSARDIKAAGASELEGELKAFIDERTREMNDEAASIEEKGRQEALRLKEIGERNFERAVEEVVKFIKQPRGGQL
ncbi:MAG: hypothetical protein IT362_00365 [Deltaproteobacteria bacterium]|nr:hypothetical protein [Deltaproteobacteria bacterium]